MYEFVLRWVGLISIVIKYYTAQWWCSWAHQADGLRCRTSDFILAVYFPHKSFLSCHPHYLILLQGFEYMLFHIFVRTWSKAEKACLSDLHMIPVGVHNFMLDDRFRIQEDVNRCEQTRCNLSEMCGPALEVKNEFIDINGEPSWMTICVKMPKSFSWPL